LKTFLSTKFSDFQRLNEEVIFATDIKVGDYVILKDTYYEDTSSSWHNNYGVIVNLGYEVKPHIYSNDKYIIFVKFRPLCELSNETISTIKTGNENNAIKGLYDKNSEKFLNLPVNDKYGSKYDHWVYNEYATAYPKEEWDKVVERIELEKAAKIYNI
jgi:hypothetical protein